MLLVLLISFIGLALDAAKGGDKRLPFYRYFNPDSGDHFYTADPNEIGTTTAGQIGKNGYKSEGIGFFLPPQGTPKSTCLYRWFNTHSGDHFYTIDPDETGTKSEGVGGYCFNEQEAGTVPLYRYYQSSSGDHFYTTNDAEIGTTTKGKTGRYGYLFERIECFVYNKGTKKGDIIPDPAGFDFIDGEEEWEWKDNGNNDDYNGDESEWNENNNLNDYEWNDNYIDNNNWEQPQFDISKYMNYIIGIIVVLLITIILCLCYTNNCCIIKGKPHKTKIAAIDSWNDDIEDQQIMVQ